MIIELSTAAIEDKKQKEEKILAAAREKYSSLASTPDTLKKGYYKSQNVMFNCARSIDEIEIKFGLAAMKELVGNKGLSGTYSVCFDVIDATNYTDIMEKLVGNRCVNGFEQLDERAKGTLFLKLRCYKSFFAIDEHTCFLAELKSNEAGVPGNGEVMFTMYRSLEPIRVNEVTRGEFPQTYRVSLGENISFLSWGSVDTSDVGKTLFEIVYKGIYASDVFKGIEDTPGIIEPNAIVSHRTSGIHH